ncbi:MAG: N-acetylmannosamine-6-phosphate 2-epimerase [Bacillota bacterium]|jgi:N-acylglucosamine-6-phosphate 2-epimerase
MAELNNLKGGIIVSCQARNGDPLNKPEIMAAMAQSVEMEGVVGIRANGEANIKAIRSVTKLPIIGINKIWSAGSSVYITPSPEAARTIVNAGADIVALDATLRERPGGVSLKLLIDYIHEKLRKMVMADISTFEEGSNAAKLGVDLVATTLSGYTSYSRQSDKVDLELVQKLTANLKVPVIAEGKIVESQEVKACFAAGAFAVVIGKAITRPQDIVKRFITMGVFPKTAD